MLIVAKQDDIDDLYAIWDTITDRFIGVNLGKYEAAGLIMDYKAYEKCEFEAALSRVENSQPFIDIAKQICDELEIVDSYTNKSLEEENKRLLDIIDNKLGGWLEWSRKYCGCNGISLDLLEKMFFMSQKYEDIIEWLNREIEMAKISMDEYAECFDGVHVDNKKRKELLKGHIRFCENALRILKE